MAACAPGGIGPDGIHPGKRQHGRCRRACSGCWVAVYGCVCVCACMRVRKRTHMHARTHTCTHAHMHTCTHARNAHTTTQTVHACTRPRTIHRLWFSRGVPLLGCVSRHVVLAQLHTSESLLAPSEFIYFHPKTEHQRTDVHCCLQGRSGHPLLTVVQTTLSHPLPPP